MSSAIYPAYCRSKRHTNSRFGISRPGSRVPNQLPEFSGFPTMPLKEGDGPPVLILVDEDYYSGNNKIGKLGHRIDLYPQAAKPARI
jgi:hypothetical protein